MALGVDSMWGVVLPLEKTNLLENPSFELGTTGVAAIQSAAIGSAANTQQFGAWSCFFTPNSNGTSGAAFGTWTASNGSAYTVSAYVNGQAGVSYMIGVGDSAGVNLVGSTAFTGGGTWQRHSYAFTEAAGAVRRVVIRKLSGNNTGTVYVDGQMAEMGSLTTYIDGDQEGCTWNDIRQASTSFRSGQSRAGGSVVALADLGFTVNDAIGIGMPPLETTSQSFAIIPGAEFQGQRAAVRPIVLTSRMDGTTWRNFETVRRTVINALKIDAVTPQQPIRFWYVGGEGTVQIDAVMDAGMEGGNHDGFGEEYAVRFLAFDPYFRSTTEEGTALASRASIGSANYLAYRDPLGRWGTMGASGSTVQGAAPTSIYSILPFRSGTILFGGQFGTVAGTVYPALGMWMRDASRFGTWTGGTVNQTGGPGATTIYSLVDTPFGSVFVGGNVGTFGGTVRPHVAIWNGNFGTLIGGSINAQVRAMAYNGTLFFGGNFTIVAGTTAPFVAQHVNNAFGTLGSGTIDSQVLALTFGLDGRLFVAGQIGSANGTESRGLAFWAGSWGTVSGGFGSGANPGTMVTTLLIGQNGILYAGGAFTYAGQGSANSLAQFNGVQLTALGSGVLYGAANPSVQALYQDTNSGNIYIGGRFNSAGGIPTSDGFAVYNGYAYLTPDIAIDPGSGTIYDITQDGAGTLYIGGNFTGTAKAGAVAQVVNTGAAEAYPTLRVRNTGSDTARVYQLVNTLTGDAIYTNYTMLAGEELTLDLTPGDRSFTSTFKGNIFGKIIGGSNLATFRLLPGTNYVSFFSDSDNLSTSLTWKPASWSAAGTVD